MSALSKQTAELSTLPLLVCTRSSITPEYIVEETNRLKRRERINLVVVDHMQLMASSGETRGDYEKFTAISRAMKQVSVEIGVPVLLVSQTNRLQAKEHRGEVEVSDLRGCLDGAAMVLLSDGRRKQIRNVVAGDSVLGLSKIQKLVAGTVQRAWKTGRKEVYRIRTRFGREIVATGNHPFRVPGGWKALNDLEVGDNIGAILRANVSGECSEENAALCRFAGYMVGNGSYRRHKGISFTTPDKHVMDDLIAIVKRRFPEIQFRIERFEHHYEIDLVRVFDNGYGAPGANPIRQWLLENGMADLRFDQKRVPHFVFDKGAVGAREFLSGYLMTDGCIKVGCAFSVCYDTTSIALAKDTQHLLSILGVAAVVGNPTMNTKSKVPVYRVSVVRQAANTFRLLSQLHLTGKNRRKAEQALSQFRDKPDECSYLLGLPREYSIAISHKNWKLWRNTDRRIGRGKALEIALALKDGEIRMWAGSDVLWDVVTMIEPAGQMDTWDLRIPALNSFTANGLIVHNSGAIEEDAAAVLLLYEDTEDRKLAKEQDDSRYTKGPVKCILKVGKNRYGEQVRCFEFQHYKACTRFDLIAEEEGA
jgi:replicative DNA helicase